MASGIIKRPYTDTLTVRAVNVPYTVSGNGTAYANLKTVIDNDMPSGYKCLGIVGFTTNDQNVLVMSIRYVESSYSLQVRSFYSGTITNNVAVLYLCMKS